MNKFQAINYIRSSNVMTKPVKDTFEFRCNGVHFATITKSENGAYYIHRRNASTVVVSHFMQAVAELLPLFLGIYLDECKNVRNHVKDLLNGYKMAYERSIKNLNKFYKAPENTVSMAYSVSGELVSLFEVEEIALHDLRPSGYSKTLEEGLTFNIKNLEKTLKDIEKDIDETIKNL
ncbi:hypothetical protein vBEcoMRo111lw_00151 [Escherichia phage vB_EcoM-Ro111lw]|uniref:Uncharacterized protein n=1 Tax=Escherichia phage vB_EcoM-Ro111lw TaxID=2282989 RepID=A0A494RBM8_9CAUD|nr:hypothetical protein vBEcoMRo111lw_00151 [Escherichia phage vB_EcoM-Ro111lw]EGP0121671.1 hypothetical protein [Escherichia coli]